MTGRTTLAIPEGHVVALADRATASYWTTVIGGLAASMAIIAATFPILDRITGPEVARNE